MAFWTSAPARTKVKKLKEEGCSLSLSVEIPHEKFDEAMQNALVQIQARVTLPGFRTGKAPLQMVKQHFPDQIKERALDRVIQSVLPDVIKEQDVHPVSAPVVKSLNYEENKPISLQLELECAPKFEPRNYTKAQVTKKTAKVTDEDAGRQINELLEHNAQLEPVSETETAGKEHFVVVDYETFSEGKPVPGGTSKGELVDMSSPQTIAGLAENILGAKKGETREFDSALPGKKMHFKVTITEIKRKKLPELNDEFVKGMGFEKVEQFKAHVRQVMEKDATEKSEKEVLRQLEDHLVRENPIPVPLSLVENHLNMTTERIKERLMPEEKEKWNEAQETRLKERMRPAIERDIRLSYLLRSIALKEKLEADARDFEQELEKNVSKITEEQQKQQVRKVFEARREDIMAALTEKKVIEFLKSQATTKEAA